MPVQTSVLPVSAETAGALLEAGGAFVDLRKVPDYLDVHVPGSLCLTYEFGPGMPGRARDCIPLSVPLVLLEAPDLDMGHVTAGLRGKGFAVTGVLEGGLDAWSERFGNPASTEVYEGRSAPAGKIVDVGDPGTRIVKGAERATVERLWARAPELVGDERLVIAAGRGVRAALAVGMFERAGAEDLVFWWTAR